MFTMSVQLVGPLISMFRPGQAPEDTLRVTTDWDAIKTFEQIQAFKLDTEQANVRKQIS